MSDPKEDLKLVESHCNALAEHFDTVQIFVTRHEAGELDGTRNLNYGAGNWFARYGQVYEWCVRRDEDTRIAMRKENE